MLDHRRAGRFFRSVAIGFAAHRSQIRGGLVGRKEVQAAPGRAGPPAAKGVRLSCAHREWLQPIVQAIPQPAPSFCGILDRQRLFATLRRGRGRFTGLGGLALFFFPGWRCGWLGPGRSRRRALCPADFCRNIFERSIVPTGLAAAESDSGFGSFDRRKRFGPRPSAHAYRVTSHPRAGRLARLVVASRLETTPLLTDHPPSLKRTGKTPPPHPRPVRPTPAGPGGVSRAPGAGAPAHRRGCDSSWPVRNGIVRAAFIRLARFGSTSKVVGNFIP